MAQVWLHAASGRLMVLLLSRNCTPRPSETCLRPELDSYIKGTRILTKTYQAIWQCMSQAPGLSVGNAMTTQPPPGRNVVSLLGGLLKFNVDGPVVLLKTPVPVPRTQKSWPTS